MHGIMQNQEIIYQQSPQFLAKVSIRIENLLAYVHEGTHQSHPIIHHCALKNIIELLKIIEKPELKSRFTKEFLRLEYTLSKILPEQSPELWHKFKETALHLQNRVSRLSNKIFNNHFLHSMRAKIPESWQECELQTPHLYRWLHQSSKYRKDYLQSWLEDLADIENIVQIYLSVLRFFLNYNSVLVHKGYYHQLIYSNPSCQLIVIKVNNDIPAIPKIQIGNNSLSVYFNDLLKLEEINNLDDFYITVGIARV